MPLVGWGVHTPPAMLLFGRDANRARALARSGGVSMASARISRELLSFTDGDAVQGAGACLRETGDRAHVKAKPKLSQPLISV